MNFDTKRLPLALFSIYFLKTLAGNASAVDVGILLVLAGTAGFYEAWSQAKLFKTLEDKLKSLDETQIKLEKDNQDLKTYITGLKLGQTFRAGGNGR